MTDTEIRRIAVQEKWTEISRVGRFYLKNEFIQDHKNWEKLSIDSARDEAILAVRELFGFPKSKPVTVTVQSTHLVDLEPDHSYRLIADKVYLIYTRVTWEKENG